MDEHAWNALIEDADSFRFAPGQSAALRLGESLTSTDYEALFADAPSAGTE